MRCVDVALRTHIRVKPLVLFTRVKIVSQDLLFLDFLRFSEVESDLRGITWELAYIAGDKVFYALLRPFLVCSWSLTASSTLGLPSTKLLCYYTLFDFMKGTQGLFHSACITLRNALSFILNILSQGKKIFMSFISDYTRTIIESIKIKRSKRLR